MSKSPIILMPVYNDWPACSQLLRLLDEEFQKTEERVRVVLVDDGSPISPEDIFTQEVYRSLEEVRILSLRQNMGHQRAIAIGLCWVSENFPESDVVVMDSDGEDAPSDVPRLLTQCRNENGKKIVMAIRSKRSETFLFRFCYFWFKFLFHMLTGQPYRMGNFSVIPASQLPKLVGNSGLWCHYAATVFRSRIPYTGLETVRAKRLDGKSQMNFVGLVMHGFSAIAVYLDIASVRMMILCLAGVGLLATILLGIVSIRFFTDMAIPGWASMVFGLTLVLMVELVGTATILSFVTLGNRQVSMVHPRKEFQDYIAKVYFAKKDE